MDAPFCSGSRNSLEEDKVVPQCVSLPTSCLRRECIISEGNVVTLSCVCAQLLSKQPGYHRPQPSAPPAQLWQPQNGANQQPPAQHAGWGAQPAAQYQQQQHQPQQQVLTILGPKNTVLKKSKGQYKGSRN